MEEVKKLKAIAAGIMGNPLIPGNIRAAIAQIMLVIEAQQATIERQRLELALAGMWKEKGECCGVNR